MARRIYIWDVLISFVKGAGLGSCSKAPLSETMRTFRLETCLDRVGEREGKIGYFAGLLLPGWVGCTRAPETRFGSARQPNRYVLKGLGEARFGEPEFKCDFAAEVR